MEVANMGHRVDLTGDVAYTAEQLLPLVRGAEVVGILSPWDDELGHVVTGDEEFPAGRRGDDIIVVLRRDPGQTDLAYACALAARLEEKAGAELDCQGAGVEHQYLTFANEIARRGAAKMSTHRDLLEALADELEVAVHANAESWCSDAGRANRDAFIDLVWTAREYDDETSDDAEDLVDELFTALEYFAALERRRA